MLKRIFPPTNELTVFVITVTLLSMFFYMEGWTDKAIISLSVYLENILTKIDEAKNFIHATFLAIGYIAATALLIAVVFGPLFLPFNNKDLRRLCIVIITIHASIIAYGNINLTHSNPSILNSLFAFYSITWAIYILIRNNELDYLINSSQAKAIPSCIAATISVISVFIAIKTFSMHWWKAYSISSVLTPILFTIVVGIYFKLNTVKK